MQMTVNLKGGPVIALVLALADEMIDIVQATHDTLLEEQADIKSASEASAKLERLCLLRSLVEMQIGEHDDKPEPSLIERVTAYLQEHDPSVFPFDMQTIVQGSDKYWTLNTRTGISGDTAEWLDTLGVHFALNLPVRSLPTEPVAQCACQSMDECNGAVGCQVAEADATRDARYAEETPAFPATKQPGFRPDIPPRPIRAPDMPPAPEHKREIHPGMPMSGGEQQGMPGGRVGDR